MFRNFAAVTVYYLAGLFFFFLQRNEVFLALFAV